MSEYVVWNELGNVYIKIGAVDEAISAYLKAIEMNPRYGWPYSNIAFAYMQKGKYNEAINLYKKSIELLQTSQEKAVSWNRLGDTYRQLQDYTRALEAYQTADQISNALKPTDEILNTSLLFPTAMLPSEGKEPASDCCSQIGHSQTKITEEMPKAEPSDAPMLETGEQNVWLASIPPEMASEAVLLENADQERPFFQSEEPVEGKSRNISDWLRELLHADACQETKMFDKGSKVARKDFAPAPLEINAGNDQRHSNGYRDIPIRTPDARLSPALGEVAQDVLELDTSNDPNSVLTDPVYESFEERYPAVTREEEPDWSMNQPTIKIPPKPQQTEPLDPVMAEIKKYEKIVNLNDSNDRAWDILGKLYKSQGRYDDATQAFGKAIALAPHQEAYHYNLGLVYTVQNRYMDAIESFQNVIALNDQYILAHGALAGCYRRLGKHDEAAEHIKLATPMMADEGDYNRACFTAICGDNDQALELLRSALIKQDVSLAWVLSDPDLESIRSDARYQALIQEAQSALDNG